MNASVTVTGGNSIYVFGGFDQYTDEGESQFLETQREEALLSGLNVFSELTPGGSPHSL